MVPAAASPLATKGLTRVTVTSEQALPPPYHPGHAVLKSDASVDAFEHVLKADRIGVRSHPTSSAGCAGGTQYTVVLTYQAGRRTSLDAYQCGGSITGDIMGNVGAFVKYLASLIR